MKRRKERRGVVAAPRTNKVKEAYQFLPFLQPLNLTNGKVEHRAISGASPAPIFLTATNQPSTN
jgi:hypothetical protein